MTGAVEKFYQHITLCIHIWFALQTVSSPSWATVFPMHANPLDLNIFDYCMRSRICVSEPVSVYLFLRSLFRTYYFSRLWDKRLCTYALLYMKHLPFWLSSGPSYSSIHLAIVHIHSPLSSVSLHFSIAFPSSWNHTDMGLFVVARIRHVYPHSSWKYGPFMTIGKFSFRSKCSLNCGTLFNPYSIP